MAADQREMWINAMKVVAPSEETLLGIGRDVVDMLRHSMRRDRERDEMEPIGNVVLKLSAS